MSSAICSPSTCTLITIGARARIPCCVCPTPRPLRWRRLRGHPPPLRPPLLLGGRETISALRGITLLLAMVSREVNTWHTPGRIIADIRRSVSLNSATPYSRMSPFIPPKWRGRLCQVSVDMGSATAYPSEAGFSSSQQPAAWAVSPWPNAPTSPVRAGPRKVRQDPAGEEGRSGKATLWPCGRRPSPLGNPPRTHSGSGHHFDR